MVLLGASLGRSDNTATLVQQEVERAHTRWTT